MSDFTTVNENCPGTGSELAGKVTACEGCPNQQICSSGVTKQVDPGIELVKQRLENVKYKVLILSGKGGVGKSTFTSLLGRFLAASQEDKNLLIVIKIPWPTFHDQLEGSSRPNAWPRENTFFRFNHTLKASFMSLMAGLPPDFLGIIQVGICDVDICGPSAPRMLGVLEEQVHQSGSGWSPVYVEDNLSVMSIGFLLGNPDDAIIWRGPKKNAMIRQFLSEVDWGQLEFLLIDTPPGTSDEHLSVYNYLKHANLSGAVIITTPQEVALLDVRKEIDFCKKVKIPIVGVVENMTCFTCPNCLKSSLIFRAKTGGAEAMCTELNVSFLGSVPLDPMLARSCDEGIDFVEGHLDSPAATAFKEIAKKIVMTLEKGA